MESPSKPTFQANTAETAQKSFRKEAGVIWERKAQNSGMKFFSIKIKLPKDKLQELMTQVDSEGMVETKFVAFPNKFKQENDNKPSFRIYEEKEK